MTGLFAARLAAVLGLALAPAAAHAAPASAQGSLKVMRPDITVVITGRGARTSEGRILNVSLDGEVTGQDAEHDYGFRSIRLKLDVDCRRGRDRLKSIEMFPAAHLSGKARTRQPPGDWAQPSTEAWLGDVIRSLCGKPALALAAAVAAPVAAVDPAPSSPASTDAASSVPAAGAKASPIVQVAAADTQAGAQTALDRLKKMKGVSLDGLYGVIEAAKVKGKPVYRATLTGFAGLSEARAFCVAVRSTGGKCFVR